MRSILEANNNLSTSKAISEVQPQQQQNINLQEHEPEPGNSLSGYNGLKQNSKISKDHYSQSLNELRILIENTFPSTDARYSAFIRALELLWSRYELIIDATNPILSSELWPQIFSWLYLLPNIVSLEMQQRHPVALVLFSYFAVLLQELDSVWFIQGWSSHIVRRISNDLDNFHSPFLSWPRMRLLLV
ncbi:hypothetical protein N7456_012004 [Penicillium angulare]|uniref:Uncharacterized protein n=1 Tax=Penicillium angulare TaxID=116970 RepID=A0A9W9EUV3_9EURO|nr:hypothetical protein N7456_012004 [Penicillium angulare]